MWKSLPYFPPPTSLLQKTLILLSFKDNTLYKARYWSNGILRLGEEVGIHVKFPSTQLNSVSNPLHGCLQNDTRKCLTWPPSSPWEGLPPEHTPAHSRDALHVFLWGCFPLRHLPGRTRPLVPRTVNCLSEALNSHIRICTYSSAFTHL